MVGSKCRDFKNREVSNVNAPTGKISCGWLKEWRIAILASRLDDASSWNIFCILFDVKGRPCLSKDDVRVIECKIVLRLNNGVFRATTAIPWRLRYNKEWQVSIWEGKYTSQYNLPIMTLTCSFGKVESLKRCSQMLRLKSKCNAFIVLINVISFKVAASLLKPEIRLHAK